MRGIAARRGIGQCGDILRGVAAQRVAVLCLKIKAAERVMRSNQGVFYPGRIATVP